MNELKHRASFKSVLSNYHVSEASQKILTNTQLILLVAPTSSGRNTLIRQLVKNGGYHYIVSDTTRQPRRNDGVMEKSGVEYWFRDEDAVLEDLKAGKFLEAAIIHGQQVSGISIRELEKAKKEEKIAITDIEIVGVDTIMKIKTDTLAIFVLPPSFKEWQRRIQERGAMPAREYHNRMASAAEEFKAALHKPYYRFVINNDLSEAAQHIQQIATGQETDEAYQQKGRTLAKQLYEQTEKLLQTLLKY